MKITTIGIDTAKRVFEVHGVDAHGSAVLHKRLSRAKLLAFMARLEPCRVGLEACAGAHYWGRRLRELGHEPKLMNPRYVKAYVQGDKDDAHDAEGMCEAASRERVPSVAVKSVEQQELMALHRVRQGLIKQRTAQVNQLRGLLGEFGVVLPRGRERLMRGLGEVLEDAQNELTVSMRELVGQLRGWLRELDARVREFDVKLDRYAREHEVCSRLRAREGIGTLGATALWGHVGDARRFRNGRQLSASLGLPPSKHGTGGQVKLGRMHKRGDRYVRTLLIHGARAVLTHAKKRDDAQSRWLQALVARRGFNVATVALANKNARIAWALMAHGDEYRPVA